MIMKKDLYKTTTVLLKIKLAIKKLLKLFYFIL